MNYETRYPIGSYVAAARREPMGSQPLDMLPPEHDKWAIVEGHGYPMMGATLRLRDSDGPFTVFADQVWDSKS